MWDYVRSGKWTVNKPPWTKYDYKKDSLLHNKPRVRVRTLARFQWQCGKLALHWCLHCLAIVFIAPPCCVYYSVVVVSIPPLGFHPCVSSRWNRRRRANRLGASELLRPVRRWRERKWSSGRSSTARSSLRSFSPTYDSTDISAKKHLFVIMLT